MAPRHGEAQDLLPTPGKAGFAMPGSIM